MNINIEPGILRTYGFYGSLLVGKMLIMGPMTSRQRIKNKVFSNPEDAKARGGKVAVNDDVERVRRAHQNDIENIYLFFANSAFYLMTEPNEATATNLVRAFAAARLLHTVVYVNEVRQPSRVICYLAGMAVQAYMVYSTVRHFWKW